MGLSLRRRESAPMTRAQKRARAMTTEDLLAWVDASLYGIGRQVREAARSGDPVVALEEARIAAEALQAVIAELHARADR